MLWPCSGPPQPRQPGLSLLRVGSHVTATARAHRLQPAVQRSRAAGSSALARHVVRHAAAPTWRNALDIAALVTLQDSAPPEAADAGQQRRQPRRWPPPRAGLQHRGGKAASSGTHAGCAPAAAGSPGHSAAGSVAGARAWAAIRRARAARGSLASPCCSRPCSAAGAALRQRGTPLPRARARASRLVRSGLRKPKAAQRRRLAQGGANGTPRLARARRRAGVSNALRAAQRVVEEGRRAVPRRACLEGVSSGRMSHRTAAPRTPEHSTRAASPAATSRRRRACACADDVQAGRALRRRLCAAIMGQPASSGAPGGAASRRGPRLGGHEAAPSWGAASGEAGCHRRVRQQPVKAATAMHPPPRRLRRLLARLLGCVARASVTARRAPPRRRRRCGAQRGALSSRLPPGGN